MEEQLPGFVLADLYPGTLVNVADKAPNVFIKHKEEKKTPQYLGNYERKIIVLIKDTENIYTDDESLQFLSGILNACKLNLAHIALINTYRKAFSFSELKTKMQPESLILFGLTALDIELPFAMPHYQVQQHDNCKILSAPAFSYLNIQSEKAKAEKIKLWRSLQKMFNLEK